MGCEFTLNHFAETIEQVKRHFTLLTFKDSSERDEDTGSVIFLRHDVDHSLEDAVTLAEVEKGPGGLHYLF